MNETKATPAQIADAQLKITKAKTQIMIRQPFWASILLRRPLTITESVPTAAVSARAAIYVNPHFVNKLTVQQAVFLLCHEVGHVIMDHTTRRGSRDPERWNIAGDAVINDLLKIDQVGEFIEGGVDMPGSAKKSTDQVYNELPESPSGGGKGPGGIGSDIQPGQGDGTGNEPPMSESERKAQESQIKVELAQAAQAAKMQGKLSAAVADFVGDMLEVKTPWYDILERHMTARIRGDYSWARPNRRFISQGHYLPSTGKTPTLGELVIQVDVSGSISQKELAYYNGHMKRIVDLCAPEKVHVLYVDTRVVHHDEFAIGEEFSLSFRSGGGTYMVAGIKYLEEKGISPEVFVCLTDGYFSSAADDEPHFPVVWCVSTSQQPAFGEFVQFEMGE